MDECECLILWNCFIVSHKSVMSDLFYTGWDKRINKCARPTTITAKPMLLASNYFALSNKLFKIHTGPKTCALNVIVYLYTGHYCRWLCCANIRHAIAKLNRHILSPSQSPYHAYIRWKIICNYMQKVVLKYSLSIRHTFVQVFVKSSFACEMWMRGECLATIRCPFAKHLLRALANDRRLIRQLNIRKAFRLHSLRSFAGNGRWPKLALSGQHPVPAGYVVVLLVSGDW